MLQEQDKKRLKQIVYYLERIKSLVLQDHISQEELVDISVGVRLLLIHGHLAETWKFLFKSQKQPIIRARKLNLDPNADFHFAGPTRIGGLVVYEAIIYNRIQNDADRKPSKDGDTLMSLGQYLDSACLIAKGTPINRAQIIKYIANTQGGAHIDYELDGVKKPNDQAAYKILEAVPATYFFGGTGENLPEFPHGGHSAIYAAFLGTCQEIVNSSDIVSFVAKAKTLF